MEAKVKFNQFLTKKGLRQTKQRDEIVSVFLRTERHLSTQELFDIARKKDKISAIRQLPELSGFWQNPVFAGWWISEMVFKGMNTNKDMSITII